MAKITFSEVIPLALLYESEDHEIQGRTRFQKMAFLMNDLAEERGIDPYEFLEYDYGPFTKELYEDLERLEELGVVEESTQRVYRSQRHDYRLTESGVHRTKQLKANANNEDVDFLFDAAEEIVNAHGGKSIKEVLDYVYDENPEYKERSVLF